MRFRVVHSPATSSWTSSWRWCAKGCARKAA